MHRGTKRFAAATMVATAVAATSALAMFSMSDAQSSGRRTERAPAACHSRNGDERDESDERDDRRGPAAPPSTTTTTPKGQLLPGFVVGLPPSAFLRVDQRGRIVAAATNTSCRPTPGDTVFVVLPGGDITEAPYLDLAAIRWRGDFRVPGVYHRQDAQWGCLTQAPCPRVRH